MSSRSQGHGAALLVLVTAIMAILAVVAVAAIGRALDTDARQYVTFTRDGRTMTCERITDVTGRTFYDSCEPVTP